jgi:O-antigen/teichoic acid export membrane protein
MVLFSTVLLRTIFLVILLLRGYGLLAIGLVYGLAEIIIRILQFSFARKLLPQMSISLSNVNFRLLRDMLAYGINTFMYAMGALMIYQASNIVIGIYIGAEPVSQFACASAGALLLSQLLQAFTSAIKPAVSDLDARDDNAAVKEIAFLTQKYSLLMIIPGGCFLFAMGREFLQIWVGTKFQDPGVIQTMGTILSILTVGHCLRLAQLSNFLVLVGRGQHRIFGILTVFTALLCISASIISVKVFNWGLIGIAWSNFVPVTIISGTILPIYFNWKMKISTRESIRRVWQPALLGSLPTIIVIYLWKYIAPPDTWLEIIGVLVATIVVTMTSAWFLSMKEVERKRFLNIALRKKTGSYD